jgi:hypothetical protein
MDKINVLIGEYKNRNLIYEMIANSNGGESTGEETKTIAYPVTDVKLVNNSNQFTSLPLQNQSIMASFKKEPTHNFANTYRNNQPLTI